MVKSMEENPLNKRLRRKMEGLYENEALTDELDDESADVFLKWASDRVESIVKSTADLDDDQAEEAMYPRMRALRKMSRYVNRLARGTEDQIRTLQKIVIQAREIYGDSFSEPDLEKVSALLQTHQGEPKVIVQTLQQLFEGEEDGKEESLK
ncbi:MAG TPA: hypothetical protein VJ965_11375 [Anaerolineales bacterium]|nr:hypothetical protein [Anaerolineales bacterium]